MIAFAGRWRYTLLCLALLLAAVIYLLVTHRGWRMWAVTGIYAAVVAINGIRSQERFLSPSPPPEQPVPEDLATTARRVGRQLVALADELAEAAGDDATPGPDIPCDAEPAASDQPA